MAQFYKLNCRVNLHCATFKHSDLLIKLIEETQILATVARSLSTRQVKNTHSTKIPYAIGQWLWLSCQSGRFQYQRSAVRIQSLAKFYNENINLLHMKRQKINKKRSGIAYCKRSLAPLVLVNLSVADTFHFTAKKNCRG